MKRRDFCGKAGFTAAGLMAAPMALDLSADDEEKKEKKKRRGYKIEVEIYEARKDTWCHKKGENMPLAPGQYVGFYPAPAEWGNLTLEV
jgi:hypothetical protein